MSPFRGPFPIPLGRAVWSMVTYYCPYCNHTWPSYEVVECDSCGAVLCPYCDKDMYEVPDELAHTE